MSETKRPGGCRVYVGNLAFRTQWQELKDFCKKIGPVQYAEIAKDANGRSKGYGIVEYQNREDAQAAIEQLYDKELDGRKLLVKEDREDVSGRRVFVGNLSWETSWQKLKDHMKEAGVVTFADVIRDERNRSKGWGIVEFETEGEAQHATQTLNDTTLDGRKINVREDRESRDFSRNANRGAAYSPFKVYVGNLDYSTNWQKLKDTMRGFGRVSYVDIPTSSDGSSKGWATVEFENTAAGMRAIKNLNGTVLDGRKVNVREFREDNYGYGGGGYSRGGGYGGYGGGYDRYEYDRYGDYNRYDRYDYDRYGEYDRYGGGYGRGRGGGGRGRGGPAMPRSRARMVDRGEERGPRRGGGRDRDYDRGATRPPRNTGEPPEVARRIYVGNLSWKISWQYLKDVFVERVGPVQYCDVLREADGRSKGCGIVEFETHEDALKALSTMNDQEIEGRPIFVREDREDRELQGRR